MATYDELSRIFEVETPWPYTYVSHREVHVTCTTVQVLERNLEDFVVPVDIGHSQSAAGVRSEDHLVGVRQPDGRLVSERIAGVARDHTQLWRIAKDLEEVGMESLEGWRGCGG